MRASLIGLLAVTPLFAADVDVLLPVETDQLTFINVKRIAGSDLVKKYVMKELQEKLKATPVPKWLEEMGIDPWKDIDTISLGMNTPKEKPPGEDGHKKPPEPVGVLIVRGTFNGEKLMGAAEKAVRESGDQISIVKEDKLRLIKVKITQNQFFYLTLIDEKTIIAATTPEMIKDAIKHADRKDAPPRVRKALVELARVLDEKVAYYQVMEVEPGMFANIGENPLFDDVELLKKQLAEMTSYAFTVRVGGDIQMELATAMKGKDAANAFGESAKLMVDKGRTLLPLAAVAAPEWTSLINDLKKSMKVTVAGDIVKVNARITGDAISKGLGAEE